MMLYGRELNCVLIMVRPDIWQCRNKAGSAGLILPDIRHPARFTRIIRQYPVRHTGLFSLPGRIIIMFHLQL